MLVGRSSGQVYIPVHETTAALGDMSVSLLGLHAVTGCDSVSGIYGISKAKAFKKATEHLRQLEKLGDDLSFDQTRLVGFICRLYGVSNQLDDMEKLRYHLIASRGMYGASLPPSTVVLKSHTDRANYQTYIWKQADIAIMDIPTPSEHGWILKAGQWAPMYARCPAAPELVTCGCGGQCHTRRCKCRRADLNCTDACGCGDLCSN